MDAKVLPGPGTAAPARSRDGADRHSIQSVDRALLLLETIAEMGGEATLTRARRPHEAQYLDLPSSPGDADQAQFRRQGAGPAGSTRSAGG